MCIVVFHIRPVSRSSGIDSMRATENILVGASTYPDSDRYVE